MSQVRQNFHEQSEAGINAQITMELEAYYTYLAMAYHFDRDDVALKGFHEFFKHSAEEEQEHAQKLMKYQNRRGGRIVLNPIKAPTKSEWKSGLDAMQDALALERAVNESLLKLHKVAASHDDAHLTDYLEEEFLDEQVKSIKELAGHVTNLKRVGPGLGEYQFDHNSLSS
ncbi:soma ferritin-like [Oscarella lobularis]|uniref:soma ferritin-like n=1 Tax=Oscarella lobularis TaxID=121494 RepID=UPI00331318E1